MSNRTRTEATRLATGDTSLRYDALTRWLHWATAILAVTLWTLAKTWGYAQRGSPLRHGMQTFHVTLGVLLILVLVARIVWRVRSGHQLPLANTGLLGIAARGMHYVLYALLIAIVCLGVPYTWATRHPLGLLGIGFPSPFTFTRADGRFIGGWHAFVANTILILAGVHAGAALFRHYVLGDGVLGRMLPARAARRAPDPRTLRP